jgi:hypothetical protein
MLLCLEKWILKIKDNKWWSRADDIAKYALRDHMHNQTTGVWIGVANTVEDIRNIPIECINAVQTLGKNKCLETWLKIT